MHLYRWDLDRTYLDTDIHSVRGMIRSALEPAEAKRTVPGAPALLRALVDHDPSTKVSILSGSPTQMRDVLQQKLALDGIRFDQLVLKDNLRNLRRGRLRALTGQLGYKLPQLLTMRLAVPAGATETLFGDDAEVDALVYTLYADAVAGRVEPAELARVLAAGHAYPDQIEHALRSLDRLERGEAVEDVFIHVERGVPLQRFEHLGPLVQPVFSWFQAALRLVARGRMATGSIEAVARSCVAHRALDPRPFVALSQDAVRRGLAPPETVLDVFRATPLLSGATASLERALDLIGGWRRPPPAPEARRYLDFLDSTASPDASGGP